jgi:hypothetical protein
MRMNLRTRLKTGGERKMRRWKKECRQRATEGILSVVVKYGHDEKQCHYEII